MASLDELEGDTLEGVALVILIIIALVIWGIYKNFSAPADWLKALMDLIRNLWQKTDDFFNAIIEGLQNRVDTSYAASGLPPGDYAVVYTGSNLTPQPGDPAYNDWVQAGKP